MKYILVLSVFFNVGLLHGQNAGEEKMKWFNPAQQNSQVLEGQAWPAEVKNFYDRFPAKAEKSVRKAVWQLSRNAAGMKLRFRTDARSITVRYKVENKTYAMNHFPATGVSGIDLYALNRDGSWAWATGKYKFEDTISYRYQNLDLDSENYPQGREFHLYLPLYNNVSWMEIGVPKNNSLEMLQARKEKPIVVYGTSIAQGGCASRPGMAWTAILERNLHMPLVNLGFSGNGRLEKEVADLLVEIDARIFILDCLPNLEGFQSLEVEDRILATVRAIRKKDQLVPIVLTQHSGFIENRLDSSTRQSLKRINSVSVAAFRKLRAEGVRNIHMLTYDKVTMGVDGTVDGAHPSDLGMTRYAKAYEKLIKSILK
ncbi:SGNH/GDSL hydrolase family protein [Arcticibacter sp.]|uniref:SGNH/GDSL hydrolase family protein n=1 Tax=Arcticibacter sp. TaxID=1872630 RepID=UPI00388EF09B